MNLRLVPVEDVENYYRILYQLLDEREPEVNISHKAMPAWGEHKDFVNSKPYAAWYMIHVPPNYVGQIYLTRQNEIGVQVFQHFFGLGIGPAAVKALMAKHGPRRYLANVAPGNARSQAMFDALGFKVIQHTYELVTHED